VTTPDYLPTLLGAVGIALPENGTFDGVSLLPILKETGEVQRDAMYWHYPHYGNQGGSPAAGVRAGDWKLIQFFEGDRFELYNLKDDVSETHDLAAEHPEKVNELKAKLRKWQQDVGARFPTPNPDFKPS
jgi:arylsulfatase A-like enzyme